MSDNVASGAVPYSKNNEPPIDRPIDRWFAKFAREAGYAAQKLPVDLAINVIIATAALPLMWIEASADYLLKKVDPALTSLDELSDRIGQRRDRSRKVEQRNG